ncbi:MAG: AAA family ATPase [Pseudomonadota bacterium]|jgi:hypothetical protein
MTLQIRKASRKRAKLRLGISAPSGAGKTMGALLLAFGITGDWDKIGMIDTEEGSGELYVGVQKHGIEIGEFQYIRISKDFSPVHYVDAVKAFEASGVEVIIIDSLTHAWAGTEGLLDKQGKVAAKSGNSYTAWRDVTPQHNALVNSMLQSKCHIIATMRSKVEYALQDGDNGKKKVVKMGMAPIQREGMEYEFTAFFEVDSNSIASPSKDRTDLFSTLNAAGQLDKRSFVITPKVGEELLGWLNKGGEPEPTTLEKIQTLLAKVTLDPENPQDAFLQNADLIVQPDDKLNKILTYLTEKTNG